MQRTRAKTEIFVCNKCTLETTGLSFRVQVVYESLRRPII
jgi:ribosomal protein L37AE/L43A